MIENKGLKQTMNRASLQKLYLEYFKGSFLGPLLFNVFISDLFLILDNVEIASYADDNTRYCSYCS